MIVIARNTFLYLMLLRPCLDILLGQTQVGEGGFTLTVALNVIILGVAVLALAIRRRPSCLIPALIWLPFLSIALFSLSYTPDFVSGARLFLSILTFPAIFLSSFVLLQTEGDILVFLRYVVYSSIVPAIYGIIQIAMYGFEFRVNSTFGHENIFAFYLIAIMTAILYYNNMLKYNRANSLFLYFTRFYSVCLLGLLVATRTRSAWIEAVFIFIAYAVGANRKMLFALPLIPLLLFFPPIADRLSDLNTGNPASVEDVMQHGVGLNSYAWRKMLWDFALADSADARALGKGLGAFHYNAPFFFPLFQGEGGAAAAHSGYIQAIYELGIPGFIAYAGLYVGLIIAVWRFRRASRPLAYLIIAFIGGNLIINYSDNLPYYLNYNWYAWGIFGADLSWRLRRAQQFRESRQDFLHTTAPRAAFQLRRQLGDRARLRAETE